MIFSINVCPLSIKSAPQNKSGSPDTQVRATKPIISQNVLKMTIYMRFSAGFDQNEYFRRHRRHVLCA